MTIGFLIDLSVTSAAENVAAQKWTRNLMILKYRVCQLAKMSVGGSVKITEIFSAEQSIQQAETIFHFLRVLEAGQIHQ